MDGQSGEVHPDDVAPIAHAMKNLLSQRGLTQTSAAPLLREKQWKISGWVTGRTRPTLEDIARFDESLGRRRGTLLVEAGYVDLPDTVEAAIRMDPELTEPDREALIRARRGLLGGEHQ